jgi:hypothetical protein
MSREGASVEKTTDGDAVTKIESSIEASPKRKRAAQAAAEDAEVKAA